MNAVMIMSSKSRMPSTHTASLGQRPRVRRASPMSLWLGLASQRRKRKPAGHLSIDPAMVRRDRRGTRNAIPVAGLRYQGQYGHRVNMEHNTTMTPLTKAEQGLAYAHPRWLDQAKHTSCNGTDATLGTIEDPKKRPRAGSMDQGPGLGPDQILGDPAFCRPGF